MKRSFLTASFLLAAAPALAQTTDSSHGDAVTGPASTQASAPGAPVTDREDVSTLNGQLVPVGDQNRYRYSFRRWNVSTNPVGMILGSYGVSGSYALHQNVALRADVNYYNSVGSPGGTGVELGVGAPIYFRKVYSGVFLEPGVIYRHLSAQVGDGTTHVGPQVLVGYHWSWDSGLNVAAAIGAGRNLSAGSSDGPNEKIFPTGYLRFGYAF